MRASLFSAQFLITKMLSKIPRLGFCRSVFTSRCFLWPLLVVGFVATSLLKLAAGLRAFGLSECGLPSQEIQPFGKHVWIPGVKM